MKHSVGAVLLLVGFAIGRFFSIPTAVAQSRNQVQPITIGGAILSIGMPKKDTLAQFGDECRITPADDHDGWIISRKPMGKDVDLELLGSVSFTNGKLTHVSKFWVTDQSDVESFWRGLYGSVSGATGTEPTPAVIYTGSAPPQPNFANTTIFISVKGRTIQISRGDIFSEKRVYFDVQEDFGK